MEIGKTVKTLRIAQGKTQQQVADAAGVDVSYVGLVERDQRSPKLETLKKIAEALGTSVSALLAASGA